VSVGAMAEVLAIDGEDARFLFVPCVFSYATGRRSPNDDASAAEVAEHIRRFLEDPS
jgi:hypothetical protein